MKNCYIQRLRAIEKEIIRETQAREKLAKEFDVQSDVEMPRIYKKYITERQAPVDSLVLKAYNKSRLFLLSHSAYTLEKEETKGVLGSVLGMFSKKPETPEKPLERLVDEINPEEIEKLDTIEKAWNIEALYKGIQEVINRRAFNQNEIAKIIYSLKLAYCENHVALSNAMQIATVTSHNYQ
eukprot:TRINITY_DN1825_c0_g5_i1.p1 TRINITY_DN1825_c0_g5~~TRINITY_DN1825_c0_g5_i1.p1  ORF type:complete len:182 (-),score=42.51 TRINITY_DN1825_c0_g5_i1:506-1051(-)